MELTINGETKVYRKGDEYYIQARAKHSARFRSRCRTVDFFCEKDRYKPRRSLETRLTKTLPTVPSVNGLISLGG